MDTAVVPNTSKTPVNLRDHSGEQEDNRELPGTIRYTHTIVSLSQEETNDLFQKMQNAQDEGARISFRNKIIEGNIRIAYKMAAKYRPRHLPMDEVISEAQLALVESLDEYNPSVGSFDSYASTRIYWKIRDLSTTGSQLDIPDHKSRAIRRIRAWSIQNEIKVDDITDSQLMQITELSLKQVRDLRPYLNHFVSLDELQYSGEGKKATAEFLDIRNEITKESRGHAYNLSYEFNYMNDLHHLILSAVKCLSPIQQRVFTDITGSLGHRDTKTYQEIANDLHLSVGRIAQIFQEAKASLKAKLSPIIEKEGLSPDSEKTSSFL